MTSTAHTLCSACKGPQSLINGRTIKELLVKAPASHPWKNRRIKVTECVTFCATCERQSMLDAGACSTPYLGADGVMRTLTQAHEDVILRMGAMRMTKDALKASIESLTAVDSTTTQVEELGLAYLSSPNPMRALAFSEAVCKWGRGQRVFANLKRHHGANLAVILNDWLSKVDALDEAQAIAAGTGIKGLGVSFASKHLRMLSPERFGVLDEVLCLGLGYAMNTAGFAFFTEDLIDLKGNNLMSASLAQIEAGVFLMARQLVRSA
jgi:hypothetical protein